MLLRQLWEGLRSSLWFIPALIVAGAIALGIGLVETDAGASGAYLAQRWPRLFGAGAEGSRGLLSAVAGSMITVTGVTFSITVVALALASSQYTSRILRNFMRDRANQTVLGVFVGVFAYCLVVLRTVRGGEEAAFVPGVAVFTALVLAFVAIGFLIFFIHHVATSIQATSIIQTAAAETFVAIDRQFPEPADRAPSDCVATQAGASLSSRSWSPIPARSTGYIQEVDIDALFDIARECDVVVRMELGVGEFMIEGSPLASAAGEPLDDDSVRRLNAAYTVGRNRTVQQDVGYGIRQIVDVALKALSPGINDTTTAINCLDYLASIMARLAQRRIAAEPLSERAQVRLLLRGSTFSSLLDEAFDQIRQNAEGNVAVLRRLRQVLGILRQRTAGEHRQAALLRHAELVAETADRSVRSAADRAQI